jgi:hypothetical protein
MKQQHLFSKTRYHYGSYHLVAPVPDFFKGKMSLDIMVEWSYAGSRCFEEPTEGFPGMLA